MDKFFAHFIDNAIEYTIGRYKHWYTPSQYQPIDREAVNWANQPPDEFFAIPDDPPELTFEPSFTFHRDRERAYFTFESAFESPLPLNNRVWGLSDQLVGRKSRGALVLVHGYMMQSFAPLRLFAESLARQGIDIYYLALPYHMKRAPLGTWSGQYGLSSNVMRSIDSVRQGVMDVRSLVNWIHHEKGQPVILAGISLGAITCSLVTVVDERPVGLISLLGGADLSDIVFAGNSFYLIRRGLLKNGVSAADLKQFWAGISPGNFHSKVKPENIMMVAGKYDPIVTPRNASELWQAWGQPEITWLPCGHASLSFYAGKVGQLVHQFVIRRLGEIETGEAASESQSIYEAL